MINVPEQFSSASQAAIDNVASIANTSLACAERLAALNLNSVRSIMEDSARNLGVLLAVKDAQEYIALQNAQLQPAVEKAVAYSSTVYEIVSQSTTGLQQIADGQVAELKKTVAAVIEKAAKNAPAGSDVAVGAMKSAVAAANAAYDNLSKASRQAAEALEANIDAANAAAIKLVKQAA